MAETRGYSSKLIQANKNASDDHPGVMLGRLCIAQDIPVTDVAQFLGVTRMAVYNWFKGKERPRQRHMEKIDQIITKLKNKVTSDE